MLTEINSFVRSAVNLFSEPPILSHIPSLKGKWKADRIISLSLCRRATVFETCDLM
jgi:hypothetical protein